MSKWHSPLRARGGARGGREGGRRVARGARAPGVGERASRRRWLPGPGDPGTRRGTAGECAPVGVSATVLCGWCSRQDCTAISPSDPPLARSLLTGWSTIKRKRGKKGFQKKLIAKRRQGSGLSPKAGLCSALSRVSLHLQSKSGGKRRRGGGASLLLLDPVPLFPPVCFPHTCPAIAVIKAPSVISNTPRSPAAAPQRN